MKFSRYARLTEYAARNWGDITHREGRVFLCLVIHLNRKTGRCNPTRKAIGEFTGLHRSHVSTAVAGLASKGWIIDGPDGFLFGDEFVTESVTKDGENVTESVTNESENVTESVTTGKEGLLPNRQQSVTHLARNVTESVTPHNIAIEQNKQNKNIIVDDASTAGVNKNAEKVFEYWKRVCNKKGRVTFTKERRAAVVARLKKYSVSDLFDAIDGVLRSPHHQGLNDRHTKYDDLELICRKETFVEKFIELKLNATIGPPVPSFVDVGRSNVPDDAPAYVPTCSTCGDTGDVYETPPGADFEYFRDRRDCPDCKGEEAAAAA